MPTNFGSLPNVVERQGASSRKVSQCWQVATVAGKVPNLEKVPGGSIARCVPLYVYYIQFGQYTHPMGSGRPPWAAGEYINSRMTFLSRSEIVFISSL